MKFGEEGGFDPEAELEAAKAQLERLNYPRINSLKVAVVSACQKPAFEPWYSTLILDFIHGVENYCTELGETIGKDRLSATAWSARSLLELLVWINYCRASIENARGFHEDALRDLQGLVGAHAKTCNDFGFDDQTSAMAMKEIQTTAKRDLEIDEIDAKYLPVDKAAKACDYVWSKAFPTLNKRLSKFTHPTAILIHGMHEDERRRDLQICMTMEGVDYASLCVVELEGILGVVDEHRS